MPPGDYLLEVEAADEALLASQPVEIAGDAELDLQLALSGPKVDVLVTASSTPLSVHEVAKAVDVVDAAQIALRNELALGEALRAVPGLRVRQLRGPGGQTSIQTRGLRTQDTAVLIDGLRFRDAAATQGDASGLLAEMNLVDTDRIEVLRGSGSSLYGSHAMGGVINLRPSEGGGRTHGDIRTEGGGLGMLRGVARVGGGLLDDRFVYSGGLSHLNVTKGLRGGSPHRNSSAQGFARYRFTPTVSVTGRAWGSDAFTGLNESPTFNAETLANFPATGPVPAIPLATSELKRYETGQSFTTGSATFIPDAIDPDSRRVASFVAASVALEQQLSPNGSYRLAYQLADTNRSFQDGPAGPGSFEPAFSNDSRFDARVDLFQARTDHRLGSFNLVSVGYEYEREEVRNLQLETGPAPSSSEIGIAQSSHAIFGQDQVRLLDGRLQLAVSGRAQTFGLKDPEFQGVRTPYQDVPTGSPPSSYTGDASAAYFFRGSETKLRGHVGNSYRAPSSYERFGGSFYQGFASYYGDPRLSPERSVSVDGGLDQWLAGGKARLSGTFFYTELHETILFDFANFPVSTDPFGRFGGYRNGGGGVARGAEVSGQIAPAAGTSIQASYTFTNSDSRTPTIGSQYFDARRLRPPVQPGGDAVDRQALQRDGGCLCRQRLLVLSVWRQRSPAGVQRPGQDGRGVSLRHSGGGATHD